MDLSDGAALRPNHFDHAGPGKLRSIPFSTISDKNDMLRSKDDAVVFNWPKSSRFE